ncbi:MAG: NnrU family protein [Pseudomonadota bacterium]
MILLILGVALWSAAHLFKRLAPSARAGLGDAGRGMVAVAIVASVVLMVIGYRTADGAVFWGRTPTLVAINNVLMLLAVYLYAVSGMKTWLASKTRHPQLNGFKTWCVAHLIVNGDVASFVLFGGLLAWAVVQMILISKAEGRAFRTDIVVVPRREVMAIVGTLIVTAVIMGIHAWLGVVPWG